MLSMLISEYFFNLYNMGDAFKDDDVHIPFAESWHKS